MTHYDPPGEAASLMLPRTVRPAGPEPGHPLRRYSTQGGFAEGDHVTRDGTDVHIVRTMSDCGTCADFECIHAPADGWTAVGEVEYNLCRRYTRVRPASAQALRKAAP